MDLATTSTTTNPPTMTATTTTTSQPAPTTVNSAIVDSTCMELALEGERLCKAGKFKEGVENLESALQVGTGEARTLSAIYSQLGNAYFYMENYQKALEYHQKDVDLVHRIGDEAAEAKACGNLGNTFKQLGKFDDAAIFCRRYLEISKKLQDEVGEARALYNLGNVFHTQGKRMLGSSEQEPGEVSNDIKSSLLRAVEYYEMNLKVVTKLKDLASMGRAYGNLGNTHYILGNFKLAVENHEKRLELARQTNDKSAERRAHLNLGNANIFIGNFQEAASNYSATLKLAQELQDRYTEAHSCYSLANTYTFLRDYKSAIIYHLKYIDMIKDFDDKLGEGRACWSLVNLYQMVFDYESALEYAKKHHEIAELLGDKAGLASAKLNIEELEEIISERQAAKQASSVTSSQQPDSSTACSSGSNHGSNHHHHHHRFTSESINVFRLTPDKRQEQEQRRFKKQLNSNLAADIDGLAARRRGRGERGAVRSSSSERLFDMIAHFQSGRIDDQRCEILKRPTPNTDIKTRVADDKENLVGSNATSTVQFNEVGGSRSSQLSITSPMNAVSAAASAIKATYRKASLVAYPTTIAPSIQSQRRPTVSAEHREQLFDLIAGAQGQRMDEQRASLPALTLANGVLKNPMNAGLLSRGHTVDHQSSSNKANPIRRTNETKPETIHEVQGREKSHSVAPQSISNTSNIPSSNTMSASTKKPRPNKLTRQFQTVDSDAQVHDEKFLDSLMKYQSTRFNDQRSEIPKKSLPDAKAASVDKDKGQADNFFNLIVRFQSDRIDDQRSAPPVRNENL